MNKKNEIAGRFWIKRDGRNFLGEGKVELLKHIQDTGSISKAAKIMGMSYKAAWDDVDSMNNLSDSVMVERTIGGKKGGGSVLTSEAVDLLAYFERIQKYFVRFLNNIKDIEKGENTVAAKVDSCTEKDGEFYLSLSLPSGALVYAYSAVAHEKGAAVNISLPPAGIILAKTKGICSKNKISGKVSSVQEQEENSIIFVDTADVVLKAYCPNGCIKAGDEVTAAFGMVDVWVDIQNI